MHEPSISPKVGLPTQRVESFLSLLRTSGHFDLRHVLTVEETDVPVVKVALDGPDVEMLTARNGELLLAMEHIAAKLLRLEPEQHDQISFDADDFKVKRDLQLHEDARAGIEQVQATGRPFKFPPMTSRERRMLHLALQDSGLPTASSGENPRRFVVLYPVGGAAGQQQDVPAAVHTPERTNQIRSAFRRR
jgi:spoIIIJ-associated protein